MSDRTGWSNGLCAVDYRRDRPGRAGTFGTTVTHRDMMHAWLPMEARRRPIAVSTNEHGFLIGLSQKLVRRETSRKWTVK